jgi:hypothetical protein
MDDARRLQIETLRSWSPERRLLAAGGMIELARAMVDACIRRQNPGISDDELGRIRFEEAVAEGRRGPAQLAGR